MKRTKRNEINRLKKPDLKDIEISSPDKISVAGITSFVLNLYDLVTDPKTDEIVHWNPESDDHSFRIVDASQFSKLILPQYFKTKNYSSFIRQLNKYRFSKRNRGKLDVFFTSTPHSSGAGPSCSRISSSADHAGTRTQIKVMPVIHLARG